MKIQKTPAARACLSKPEIGEVLKPYDGNMKGRKDVFFRFILHELIRQQRGGGGGREAGGVARLKLFKQSVFFQRSFPVLFFSYSKHYGTFVLPD